MVHKDRIYCLVLQGIVLKCVHRCDITLKYYHHNSGHFCANDILEDMRKLFKSIFGLELTIAAELSSHSTRCFCLKWSCDFVAPFCC